MHEITLRDDGWRRLRTTLGIAGALLSLASAAGGVATASAAAPCSGPSCVGRDPGNGPTRSCMNGAKSLETVIPPGGGAAVTLRWSRFCTANWAKCCGGPQPGYLELLGRDARRPPRMEALQPGRLDDHGQREAAGARVHPGIRHRRIQLHALVLTRSGGCLAGSAE